MPLGDGIGNTLGNEPGDDPLTGVPGNGVIGGGLAFGNDPGSDLGNDPLSQPLGSSTSPPPLITGLTSIQSLTGNYLKQGDTAPGIYAILCDQNGPVDLSTATSIQFKMRGRTQIYALVNSVIAGPWTSSGVVYYSWGSTDTAVADVYLMEFCVTFASSDQLTFPNYGYAKVYVSLPDG